MFKVLEKIFIKDNHRESYGILAGITGIVANFILFAVKFVIGSLSKSISISADAFNNLNDAVSSVISILGFKMSGRAPDREHPFGHGRSEYIAGLAVAVLILLVGIEFLKSSFMKILNPASVVFSYYALGILILSVMIKIWMWSYNRYAAKKINSTVLYATAQDSFNDSIITVSTIVSMLLSGYVFVDGCIGLAISIFIIYTGIRTLQDTLSPLLGEAADETLKMKVEEILTGFEGVLGVHDFILHDYGQGRKMATIDVEVPDTSNIVSVHTIIDKAEKRIAKELNIFIVIHTDPVSVNDTQFNKAKDDVYTVIKKIDRELKIHDFRFNAEESGKHLYFDLVVPFSYTDKKRSTLIANIEEELLKIDKNYQATITLDHLM